jgi:hypothetical protein
MVVVRDGWNYNNVQYFSNQRILVHSRHLAPVFEMLVTFANKGVEVTSSQSPYMIDGLDASGIALVYTSEPHLVTSN